jgi:hypothetical protein
MRSLQLMFWFLVGGLLAEPLALAQQADGTQPGGGRASSPHAPNAQAPSTGTVPTAKDAASASGPKPTPRAKTESPEPEQASPQAAESPPPPVVPLTPEQEQEAASAINPEPAIKEPALPELAGLPLARLIDRGNVFSGLGSFKRLLPKYGFAAYLHGVGIANFTLLSNAESEELPETPPAPTLHGFAGELSLFFGAELFDRVFVEGQFFFESDGEFSSDFAQIDLRVYRDYIIARAGRFYVPMGGINVYPEPQYMFPWTVPAMFYGTVLPGEWSELGVQFHGRHRWAEGRGFSYALYVVNGLEQKVNDPSEPISGGSLAAMRNNYLDNIDGQKSIGLQFQLEPHPGLIFGVSGYEGVYTIRDKHRLYIVDGHFGVRVGKLSLRGEFAATLQETESETLLKMGGYGLISYRFKYLEPQLMVDAVRLGGSPELDRIAPSLGVIVYPFPTKVPTASVRVGYSPRWKLDSGEFATHYGRLEVRVAF